MFFLSPADHAAGDFRSGISGWLRVKIVRLRVDHYGFPDNITDGKPVCQNRQFRSSVAGQQRRQVARMAWMATLAGVKMSLRIGEALPAAVPALMDMEREKARFRFRQTADFDSHHGAVLVRRKVDDPV